MGVVDGDGCGWGWEWTAMGPDDGVVTHGHPGEGKMARLQDDKMPRYQDIKISRYQRCLFTLSANLFFFTKSRTAAKLRSALPTASGAINLTAPGSQSGTQKQQNRER